jgi:ubiquinone/menaquinone biosynthesis C-methylase UbiE
MGTDSRTIKAYNQNAETYNHHVLNPSESPYHAYYEKPAMRAELPDLTGLNVLSVGCGSGVDVKWLAENGAQTVAGIDISEELINIAKQNYPGTDFRVMDMEALDLTDESFDLLYSSLAIHYLDDWTKALGEAYRVLKPGGTYVFSCSHPLDTALERKVEGKSKSALLGRAVDENGVRTIYGDYMAVDSAGVKPVDGMLGAFSVRIYHRPISKMVEQIHASGFIIKKLVEPLPLPEMREINPGAYEQLMRSPEFMIWVLEKSET